MIFDTHTHYDDVSFDEDREELLSSFPAKGIGTVLNVSADPDSPEKVLKLAHQWDFMYAAAGVHPEFAEAVDEALLTRLTACLDDEKCIAVGEIGLDYHWGKEKRQEQLHAFRAQIELALAQEVPILVHSRDAAEDTLAVIREYYGDGAKSHPGIIHCFSYSPEMAEIYAGLGFVIGVGGVVTFKNAKKLKETVRRLPLSLIVLETDCPYLCPEPHRGERNSSLFLPYVVRGIAALKGVSEDEVARVTEETAKALFHLI